MENFLPANIEQFYGFIGFLVVVSMGAIGSSVVLLVKVSFWAGGFKKDHERDKKDIDAAHAKHRKMEKVMKQICKDAGISYPVLNEPEGEQE